MWLLNSTTLAEDPQNQILAGGSENFVGRPCRVPLTWPTVAIERRSLPPSSPLQQEEENQTILSSGIQIWERNPTRQREREEGNPSEQPVSPRKEPTGGG